MHSQAQKKGRHNPQVLERKRELKAKAVNCSYLSSVPPTVRDWADFALSPRGRALAGVLKSGYFKPKPKVS